MPNDEEASASVDERIGSSSKDLKGDIRHRFNALDLEPNGHADSDDMPDFQGYS